MLPERPWGYAGENLSGGMKGRLQIGNPTEETLAVTSVEMAQSDGKSDVQGTPVPSPILSPEGGNRISSAVQAPGTSLVPAAENQESIDLDFEALTLESLCKVPPLEENVVLDDLRLPSVGKNGSLITWHSDKPAVLSATGKLKRSAERADVTLTAFLQNGDETREKNIQYNCSCPS